MAKFLNHYIAPDGTNCLVFDDDPSYQDVDAACAAVKIPFSGYETGPKNPAYIPKVPGERPLVIPSKTVTVRMRSASGKAASPATPGERHAQ